MTNKLAFIFPGQGSQSKGMGQDLYNNSAKAKEVFNAFNEHHEYKNVSEICFNGTDEDLKQTQNTQPALLAVAIAALEALREKQNIKPDFVAGHSLGEYGALYASGVLGLETVIKLIIKRSELMSEVQGGAMSAIIGLPEDKLDELLADASREGQISVANYNTAEQLVLSGDDMAIDFANDLAKSFGAKRAIKLPVSGAFHSIAMKDVADDLRDYIDEKNIEFNNAKIPVVTNVDGHETTSANDFKRKVVEQVYSSVYWRQSVEYMIQSGVTTFVEIGNGKVLSGLIRKIDKTAKVYNISDMASLDKFLVAYNEESLV